MKKDKLSILDVLVIIEGKTKISIEAQFNEPHHFLIRILFGVR